MKFLWVVTLIAGIAVLAGGMNIEGAVGAVLMLLGMVVAFFTIPLFVLAEHEPHSATSAELTD